MKNILITAAALILVGGAAYFLTQEESQVPPTDMPAPEQTRGAPVFKWSFEEGEEEGIQQTSISLTATYENGTSDTKLIAAIEGGCNSYENADSDVYEHSTMIICYYAGLGRYFKVIEDGEGYVVQQRMFEEASPDYNPPQRPYENLTRF